jgi:hypothetical protein
MINNKKLLLCMTGTVLALASSWSFAQSATPTPCASVTISLEKASYGINYSSSSGTSNATSCSNGTISGDLTSGIPKTINVPVGSTILVKIAGGVAGTTFVYQVESNGSITCNEKSDILEGDFNCISDGTGVVRV